MKKFSIAGLINIETTLKIDNFPLHYNPVNYPFNGVHSNVSGVGYNVAKALTTLGSTVDFLSITGDDDNGLIVDMNLERDNIKSSYIKKLLPETAQSIIIYEDSGRRQIHVDLKDLQETAYPTQIAQQVIKKNDMAIICNINFARPFLKMAKEEGRLVATDVHAIESLNDEYNQDFLENADILFLSDENLPASPEEFSAEIIDRFSTQIVVIGLGDKGALLREKDNKTPLVIPAVKTRKVINTIGAGDALFSAFIYNYAITENAKESLEKAVCFASYKIGEKGAASGFLCANELDKLHTKFFS